MPALLQYVANQLKSSESLDLLVLKEMVQTMTVRAPEGGGGGQGGAGGGEFGRHGSRRPPPDLAPPDPALGQLTMLPACAPTPITPSLQSLQGHQAVFDVSEGLLDALAGSDTLIAEVVTQGEHRASDKSLQRASARLLAALMAGETLEQRLAMPLLVLVAQQRKLIVLQSQVAGAALLASIAAACPLSCSACLARHAALTCPALPSWPLTHVQSTHLKLIAELYDKCQEVCTQVRAAQGAGAGNSH